MENQKNPLSDTKNVAIIALTAAVLGLVFYSVLSERRVNDATKAESSESKPEKKSGRPDEDPYIRGPVKNTIIKKYMDLQVCYKTFLEKKPKVTDGRVSIDWQIKPDGTVKSPELVSSQLDNPELQNCMIEKIKSWNFPEPPEGTNKYVEHTFNFKKE